MVGGRNPFGLEQVARTELFLFLYGIFVAMFASEYIIDHGGALRAQSALTMFAKSNGGRGGMIEAVQWISSFESLNVDNRMSQDRLHFIRRGFAWIAKIDLVMFAVRPHVITQIILGHEFLHAVNGCWFRGVRADVHHLHAQAFIKSSKFQFG